MTHPILILSIPFVLAALMAPISISSTYAEEKPPTEICNVSSLISTFVGKDGPLKGCRKGDIAHFQIDKTQVPPATVAARHCDFTHQIMVDTIPRNKIAHLVCKYKWKWAKQVDMLKHPDARK